MSKRKRHGASARLVGTLAPVYEPRPTDEQVPPTQAAGTDPIATGRDAAGKIRTSAAGRALALLPRRGRFLPRKVACHPSFAAKEDQRRDWLRKRTTEVHTAHGALSHGVGARLNSAAWLYAGADFAAEQGALTLDVEWFKLSATLATAARVQDDSAWELAALESAKRPEEPFDLGAALTKGMVKS